MLHNRRFRVSFLIPMKASPLAKMIFFIPDRRKVQNTDLTTMLMKTVNLLKTLYRIMTDTYTEKIMLKQWQNTDYY